MRLYHRAILTLLAAWLVACAAPRLEQAQIQVTLIYDNTQALISAPAGSTVQQAFGLAGVPPGNLDRSEPPLFTVLTDNSSARLIRVREEFVTTTAPEPYEQKIVQSESLPEGERLLSQVGVPGKREIVTRYVYEDDLPLEPELISNVLVEEDVPEIMVVGIKQNFTPQPIPGRIAYLLAGNAWLMEGTTAKRRPVILSGDLDGRIFSLSADGRWLLFTRRAGDSEDINTLWAARVDTADVVELDFSVGNIVHFADWAPDSATVAYSTVEPRSTAPGWQANNDLTLATIASIGYLLPARPQLDSNAGGLYGWWGTTFAWSPAGDSLAYARPDSVGYYRLGETGLQAWLTIVPYRTGGDWAWSPGITWSPDGAVLYTVSHAPAPGGGADEESPVFDLVALTASGSAIRLVGDVGMFALPAASPLQARSTGEKAYQIAYLQATFPTQSDASPYRLWVMDRDGSDRREIFPPAGYGGLQPQRVVWQPAGGAERAENWLAVIYQGNIWLVDPASGQAAQVTGDGLTVRLDWK